MSDFDWMGDGPASDDPMLDVDALNANVKKAAKSGNIPEIRRLLEQADGYTYTLGVQDWMRMKACHHSTKPALIGWRRWCLCIWALAFPKCCFKAYWMECFPSRPSSRHHWRSPTWVPTDAPQDH